MYDPRVFVLSHGVTQAAWNTSWLLNMPYSSVILFMTMKFGMSDILNLIRVVAVYVFEILI